MRRKFLLKVMILSFLFVAMGGGHLFAENLLVNCDYNSSTEGYGTTKFSNYASAYAYATANATNATIVIEKTNTLSGNTFDNNHKNYSKLAVVIKDGATMGNALSKWDMTYPVTVEPGGTLTCARPISASVSNIHIKNKLIVGAKDSSKKAYVDFLSDTYQDCDISIRYNGSIEVYNADFKIQDLDAQGKLTIEDSEVYVDGAFASATFFATSLTNSTMTVKGNQISGGLSDFAGGTSNQLGNVKLNKSSITIEDGDTKVAANVTATNSTIAVNDLTINNGKTLNLNEGSTLEAENITAEGTGSVKIDGVQLPVVDGVIVLPEGNDFTGYTGEDGIWGEVWGNATTSFVIKVLDANGNVMGTTSLNNIGGIIDGDVNVTWNLKLDAESNTDGYWTMSWTTTTAPTIDNMPAKVELWVDGVRVSGGNVVLNGPDNINMIYAAVTDADGKILSYHTSIANAVAAITNTRSNPQGYIALLRNTNEEVTLPAGITLNLNGFNAANVSVPVAQIGETPYYTLAEAVAAAQDKDVIEIIKEGNYTLPEFAGKELTFKGSLGTSITDWVNKGSQGMMGSKVHFENLTISGQTENYYGLFHTNAVTYKDCNINGLRFLYSPTTFTNCAFNANGVEHSFWTYGASNVTVTDCTFKYTDRAVNCYSEAGANHELDIIFTGCTFTYEGTNDDPEGAVEINSSSVKSIDLVMDGCTAPEKGAMWFNSQWDPKHGANTVVEVDGVLVWTAPVKIGETKYGSLQAAIDAVQNGETITLLSDITENVTLTEKVGLYYTINGSDKTMNGKITVTPLSDTNDNRRITISNINFVEETDANVDFISAVKTNHYPRLTISGCDFTGSGNDGDVAIRLKSSHSVVIEDCTGIGLHSFLQNTSGWNLTINNVTVTESKGGLALGTAQNVEVRGCELQTSTYGIRLDAVLDTQVTLNGNTVSAYIPVSVRNATAENYQLTFSGEQSMTASNTDGVWCAICGTEYESGVALNNPTGNVKLTFNSTNLTEEGIYGAYEYPIEVVFSDGHTKGFETLTQAMGYGYSGGEKTQIIVHKDIEESMSSLEGNIVTDNPEGVTIKNTIVDEWIYCSENFTIGEGVTYDATGAASGLFMYAKDAVINGTVLTDCYYQRYDDTKLTINEPGSMTVKTETFILRYTDGDGEAGIYINGDNNDETTGLNAAVIYFYQGCISAKNANIKVGTYWQTNETDNQGSANLVLDNSKMKVTVNEHNMKATGNSTVTLTNGSNIDVAGGYEGINVSMDETSSMTKNGVSLFVAKIGENNYQSLQAAVDAVQEGQTIQLLNGEIKEGTIKLPATLKNVTFKGASNHASVLKDMTIMAADGNSFNYEGLTFDGIYFNNSRISLTGWRNGDETIKDLTVTNCWFKNLDDTTNSAPLHINKDASEAVNGLKFTDNVIDGATGGSKSGVYAQTTGVVIFTGNIINNVAFRPYVIQLTTDDGIADNFTVTGNKFSGSAAGRAQGLGNNAEGTDAVSLTISNNIFKDITEAQQICYWNFNEAKTTAVLEKNYYDIDIVAYPGKIYFNSAAQDAYDLLDMGIFPIYTELNADGTINTESEYTPNIPFAQIGETGYPSLEAAAQVAQAGDEILLLANVTLSEELTTPAGITLNGNGKQINGTINAGGALTIKGHTKVTKFGAGSGDVITIGEGACLEINGTGRMVIGHGATFNITGNITDAKTANVADLTPSLIMPGASFTGAGVTFNVTNAYINVPSSYCSTKPSEASGIFDFNITNSIWESAGKLAFEEATVNAKVDFALLNSVLVTGSHLVFGTASGEEGVVIDNSNVNVGTSRQIENCGTMTVKNGSVVNGAVATSSNAKNPGTLIVDNATYAVTGEFSGSDLGTGTIVYKKGATISAGSITKANIQIDATGMKAGDEVNITADLASLAGTIEVINNNMLDAKIVDGKIVIVERTLQGEGTEANPYLINDVDDLVWLQEKVDKLTQDGSTQFAGKYFKLTNDIDLSGINWNPIGTMNGDHGSFKGVFDGGDHIISNLHVEQEGDGIGLFARTAGNAVIKNLKLNNVTVKSTNNRNYVGGLVGNAYASTKIENVHVSGNVYISGRGYIGGIAGHGYVVMDNVSVVATGDGLGNAKGLITSTFWCAGGVLGYAGEGATNIMNAHVANVVVTSAAGGLGAIVGMAEDNDGTQPISGSNLSAENVEIKTYTGAYGDAYANYALGYLYGGNPTSILTGELSVEEVTIETSTGEAPKVNDAVAQIGNSIYFNLQAALNAGGNVTVLRDIALAEGVTVAADKTVVLDLNGKTITGTPAEAKAFAVITNKGDLTITDGTETEGKIVCDHKLVGSTSYAVNTITNSGTLTIAAGTIQNTSTASNQIGYAIDNNSTTGNAILVIEGGKVTASGSGYYDGIRQFCNSETNENSVTIKGGEVSSLWLQNPSDGSETQNTKDVKGSFAINGGTLNNLYLEPSTQFAGDIIGGHVGNISRFQTAEGRDLEGFISGGTFSSDVSEFCAEGFKVEQNTDGTYGVVPFVENSYVIDANGEIKTLADAIAKAKEDGTDIVTYTINGAATLETGFSHGIVDFGGREGYITIQGGSDNTRSAATFTITGGGVPDIKGVTFKDLTFYDEGEYLPTANEFMYQNFIDCKFENVKFEDGIRLSGNSVVRNCTFNANTNNEYAIWLDKGTFEMTGSTVTAGNEAYGLLKSDEVNKITISDNTFQYLAKVNKEALNVKGAIIVAEDNTFIDCAKGIVPADKVNYTADGTTQITDAIIADDNTIIIYVAKIGDVKYQSLADAATAAQDGETIQLLWAEGKAPIAMNASLYGNKNVTITGTATVDWSKGNLFIGRGGVGNATLTFNGANLTSASDNASTGIHVSGREKGTDNKYDGTVNINNSTIELDYLINKGTMTLDNSTLTVKNGFSVGGRPASETESGQDATATITLNNGSKVVVNRHNGMGLGYEAIGVMNVNSGSTFETTEDFLITAKGTMNVNGGNVKTVGTLANNGIVYVTGAANLYANVTGNGWFYMNGVALDADTKLSGAKVGFINGENTIVGSTIDNGFFSVGIGQNAAATTAADFAGANGITLGDVTVNVSENAIIGGNGETYSGWVGSAYSADKTQHTYTLNVENSLAAFGYMHVSKDGIMKIDGRSDEDNRYTYDNANVNFYAGDFIVNGNVTINDADAWVKFTKMSVDHADAVLNITGDTNYESSIHNGSTTSTSLKFFNAGTVNIEATSIEATPTVEIDNGTVLVEGAELNIASANVIAKGDVTGDGAINFTGLDAKLTAQEGLAIVDEVNDPDYAIAYLDGTYQYAKYVAQIGDEKYLTLQEAIDEAQNDETITLLVDVSQADGVIINSKNIVVDLNEKTFTVTEGASTNNRNFKITGTSVVTIKNGTMVAAGDYSSGAYGTVRTEGTAKVTLTGLKLYNYRGNGLNIKAYGGTTVNISNTEIYSQYGGGIEAAGGTITLAETVKVEQKGMYTAPYNSMAISVNSGGTVTVNGGTYSTECITAEEAGNQGTSHGPWVVGVLNSGGKLVINGGTFSNDNYGDNSLATYARGAVLADTGAEIEINGGTFNALKAIIDMTNNLGDSNNNPSALLSGGTFSADPRISGMYASELIVVAVNYEVKKLPNGYYTVIQTSGTQTREFATLGWHWFSTYIDFESGEEGLDELQEQLGGNAATIKGQTAFTNYQTYNGNNFWTSGNNSLTSISASDMYMIKTTNKVIDEENDVYEVVTVSLDGGFVDYENYEITLKKGWNWIGYPLNTEVNVTDALAGFTPENGDQIKGKIQGQTSTYISMLGGWAPDFTMMPGEGYMYYSQADDNKPLVYRTGDRGNHNVKTSVENNHWIVDEYKYSSNMTVTAMLSIDGEIVKDNYEVAAFANGECRGSARPIYIEALDAYMLFMTIQGEDVENLTFKYYDVNYGTEYELNNTMVYSNDAIVGTIEEPYMFNLGILNIDETSVDQISIYPNPTTTGKEINLQAMCDKVEVFNALGMKVAEYTNVDSIDAIETAGIYVIRVTIDGNARNCRLVVK